MSFYEARLLRYNPEEDEDDDEGMSGGTMALIAVGVLALAGGGYWFYSKKKAEEEAAAKEAESAAVATGAAPPSQETTASNEQAKQAAVTAAGSDTSAQIAAKGQYPTVVYLNGTKATVTKAEAEQMVATGKFMWNALSTSITEKDPNKVSTGVMGKRPEPAGKSKKKPATKGKR